MQNNSKKYLKTLCIVYIVEKHWKQCYVLLFVTGFSSVVEQMTVVGVADILVGIIWPSVQTRQPGNIVRADSLVVKYNIAIVVSGVRFPVSAKI